MLTPEQKESFIKLLDDDTPAIRKALFEEFERLGEEAVDFLRELALGAEEPTASNARVFLKEFLPHDTVGEFVEFIRGVDHDLEAGVLLLDQTVYPKLDLGEVSGFFDQVAKRARELMLLPCSSQDKCLVINRVLFFEYAFRGNLENFDDPLNSFLHQVIKRRKGIPISLSILYLLVAQRCGIPLSPIGFPGYVMLGCFTEKEPFYIDPFKGGVMYSVRQMREVLKMRKVTFKKSYLEPISVTEIIRRTCRNLVQHYTAQKQIALARLFARFVHECEL